MEKILLQKSCSKCGELKAVSEFGGFYCRDCTRLLNRTYRAQHHNQLIDYDRARYAAHPEIKKASSKKRRTINREKVNEGNRRYYATHPEYAERAMQRWRARRARKINALGDGITAKQWRQLKEDYGYCCAYCGEKKTLTLDHIVPLIRGGKHDLDNAVPACGFCNDSKWTFSLIMFLYRRLLVASCDTNPER